MECLNLRFVRIGSKNTVRTARTPHRAITAEGVCLGFFREVGRPVGLPDRKQWIDKQLPLYWWACLDRRRNITVRTSTTGGFQQNFGVFTNFNNVFYDLLLSYFMPGFEQICRVANYCEKIQLSTTVGLLQYLQPDLSFSLTLALPLACWTSPTSTSWVSNVFKSDRSSRSCYDPDYGKSAKDGDQGRPIFSWLLLSFVLLIQTRLSQINAGHLLVVNILFYFLFSWIAFTFVSSQYLLSLCATAMLINRNRFT